eukprot:GHRQ01016270.1.p2 GENE.GHRQ01016270.1~~GHRQ01016270.1.p2  ORF type:complete len:162 (+),score=44.88 GHRQ01016270.1:110-595(+)
MHSTAAAIQLAVRADACPASPWQQHTPPAPGNTGQHCTGGAPTLGLDITQALHHQHCTLPVTLQLSSSPSCHSLNLHYPHGRCMPATTQLEDILDPQLRRQRYPALELPVVAAALDKYRELPQQAKRQPGWPAKKAVDAVAKQLRAQLASGTAGMRPQDDA